MLIQTHSVEQKMAQNFFPRLLTPQLETPAETDTGENGENRATRDLFSREFLAIFLSYPNAQMSWKELTGKSRDAPTSERRGKEGVPLK